MYTSNWNHSTGRGGVKKHILFRSGQDFKEALNQYHYKHTIPVEVSLERLEIRHKCCYYARLAQDVVWWLDKKSSAKMSSQRVEKYFLGNQNLNRHFVKKMQRDNEGLFVCVCVSSPRASHVERQHPSLGESGNKVNPSWLKNKYTLQFAAVTRRAEAPGVRGLLRFQKAYVDSVFFSLLPQHLNASACATICTFS